MQIRYTLAPFNTLVVMTQGRARSRRALFGLHGARKKQSLHRGVRIGFHYVFRHVFHHVFHYVFHYVLHHVITLSACYALLVVVSCTRKVRELYVRDICPRTRRPQKRSSLRQRVGLVRHTPSLLIVAVATMVRSVFQALVRESCFLFRHKAAFSSFLRVLLAYHMTLLYDR